MYKNFLQTFLSMRHTAWTYPLRFLIVAVAMLALPQVADAQDLYLLTDDGNTINGITPDEWSGSKLTFSRESNSSSIYTFDINSWTIQSSDNGELRFRILNSNWNGNAYCPDELRTAIGVGANAYEAHYNTSASGKGDNYWYFTPTAGHTYRLTVNAQQNGKIFATVKLDDTTTSGGETSDTHSGLVPSGTSEISRNLWFRSDITGTWPNNMTDALKLTSSNNNNVWTYTIDASSLAKDYINFQLVNSNDNNGQENNYGLCSSIAGEEITVNDKKGNAATLGRSWDGNKGFRFASDEYNTYYVEAVHTSDGWKVAVTGENPKTVYEYSTNDGTSWVKITSSTLNISKFPVIFRQRIGSSLLYFTKDATATAASSENVNGTNEAYYLGTNNIDYATRYSIDENSLKDEGYGYNISLNTTSNTISGIVANAGSGRWLCISDGNGHTEKYLMAPSRIRGGGARSTDLFTYNIKEDRLENVLNVASGSTITYWIENGSGTEVSPQHNTFINNGKSYTFYWDNNDPGQTNSSISRYDVKTNSEPFTEPASKSYYLVGNFEEAHQNINIDPTKDKNLVKLTRYIYYKEYPGVANEDATTAYNAETMDSIIYRATVARPAEGWDQLYLTVATKEAIDAKDWGSYDAWRKMIRPEVQFYGTTSSDDYQKGMDGTALEGGLFSGEDADGHQSQALNPYMNEHQDATSYTFSMNVTYRTYRLMFNDDAMYLVGPAIMSTTTGLPSGWTAGDANQEGVEGKGSEWCGSGIKLTWVPENHCYEYLDNEGKEQKVRLKAGEKFRFCYGRNFMNTWYGEDDNVPNDISDLFTDYKGVGDNNDTQYFNNVTTYRHESNTVTNVHSIVFGLHNKDKDGNGADCRVRLYINHVGNQSLVYYTIDRRFGFVQFSQNYAIDGSNSYKYWRVFSDYVAYQIPDGVRAYYVKSVDNEPKSSYTESQVGTTQIAEITSGFIPANTGVILAATDDATGNNTKAIDFEYYSNPYATSEDAGISKNYMKAAPESGTTVYESDKARNFNFNELTYYVTETSTVDGKQTTTRTAHKMAGFWYPSDVKTANNSAFLQYDDGYVRTQAKPNSLAFTFEALDGNTTTGITKTIVTQEKDDEPYYTISGVRVGKPSVPGVYIHAGKKIIVK